MPPAVDEDCPATLGTVGDAQAVNARRVAGVVARERVWNSRALGAVWCCFGNVLQKRRPNRESGKQTGVERIRGEVHTLRQHRNARTFQCAHQGWLLQEPSL